MTSGSKDSGRALTAAGTEEIERVGASLSKQGFKFDIVAASPLKRAKDTAEILNLGLKRQARVEVWPELSPEGARDALYMRLSRLRPDSSVLLVGHEPYLTTAMSEIAGAAGGHPRVRISLKKGGLAKMSVSGFSPRVEGELRWLLTPKQIRKMA